MSPPVVFGTIAFQPATDHLGVLWTCEDLAGWSDMPENDGEMALRSMDHGGYWGDSYYKPRYLTLAAALSAPTDFALQTALHQLRGQHWQSLRSDVVLTVDEVDGSKYLIVRASAPRMSVVYLTPATARVVLELAAAWPIKRDEGKTVTATTSTAGTGRNYPRNVGAEPFWTYGVGGSTGDMYAVNYGNAPVRPIIFIDGPVTNPRIIAAEQNRKLQFNITLLAGDRLGVDTDTHAIVLNDVGNRRYVLSADSAWFELLPGQNLLQYRSDTNSGVATVNYSDGWW